MFMRNRGLLVSGLVIFGFLLGACGAPTAITATPQAAPTQPPRATEPPPGSPTAEPTVAAPEPTITPAPTAPPTAEPTAVVPDPTTVAAAAPAGDAAAGKKVWAIESCQYCHGPTAQGSGDGPKLAGTVLTWDQILSTVRNGRSGTQMQAFKASVITDQELADIYAWLKSL